METSIFEEEAVVVHMPSSRQPEDEEYLLISNLSSKDCDLTHSDRIIVNRIIVRCGQQRVCVELPIESIPKTANMLLTISKFPVPLRNFAILGIDDVVFRKYLTFATTNDSTDDLAGSSTWAQLVKTSYTAMQVNDDDTVVFLDRLLAKKAQLVKYKPEDMFTREVVDWVYDHFTSGHTVRNSIIGLTVRSIGLAERLGGPPELLSDIAITKNLHSATLQTEALLEEPTELKLPSPMQSVHPQKTEALLEEPTELKLPSPMQSVHSQKVHVKAPEPEVSIAPLPGKRKTTDEMKLIGKSAQATTLDCTTQPGNPTQDGVVRPMACTGLPKDTRIKPVRQPKGPSATADDMKKDEEALCENFRDMGLLRHGLAGHVVP